MKILGITLTNLNSLRGTWSIDLTHNAYVSDGIFSVTGRTGAGKTTIFDAVCLALYAKTPRLGKIEGQRNEIMSKHTNSCGAKVTFESNGKIYVCEWLQDRVKGKLQTKHTVSSDGKQLNDDNTLRQTVSLVTEITGMDFDRFVQAMLLEQGKFDRFLNAGKGEKAEVLELITGTVIYGEVSQRVFNRSKEEKSKLDSKLTALETEKARFDGITAQSTEAEISQTDDVIAEYQAKHTSTESLMSWLKDIRRLNTELARVLEDIETQKKRAEIFEGERKILEAAERAESLEGSYTILQEKRNSLKTNTAELSDLSAKISSQEFELSKISTELPALADELAALKGGITEPPDTIAVKIETAVNDYEAKSKMTSDAEKALADAEVSLRKAHELSERSMSEGKSARSRLNEANDNYRMILESIMGMRAKTSSAVLSEERAKLVDGMPCPLCGSLTHPKTDGADSCGENSGELFRKTELLEKELKQAEAAVKSAEKNFDEAVTNWNKTSAITSAAEQNYKQCKETLSAMKTELDTLHDAVSTAIRPLKISGVSDTQEVLRISREWAERVKALEKRIDECEKRKAVLEAGISALRSNFEGRRSAFDSLKTELEGLESSFAERLKDMNFADEESFRSARKNPEDIESIRRNKDEIDSNTAKLQGVLSNTQRQLDEKKAMQLTDKSYDEIDTDYRKEETQLRELHQKRGVLTQKLANLQESEAKIKTLEAEYDAQKKIADNWAMLNSLIGSANGDKFRVFAQQVTLELVVNNANEYLRKMNGRYTLMLTPESATLELSVRDSEQAGEVRPTTNLSGGERFIISLALALGLSQISGSKAQVDSLFIDEGFGSLDDDALNSALEALGEIRREGRMIGIISHVAGISERIPAQIHVIRKSEGSSIIEGPGCSGSAAVQV